MGYSLENGQTPKSKMNPKDAERDQVTMTGAGVSASGQSMTGTLAAPRRHGWLVANLMAQYVFGLLALTVCVPL